jgi:hypothetical protein
MSTLAIPSQGHWEVAARVPPDKRGQLTAAMLEPSSGNTTFGDRALHEPRIHVVNQRAA